MSKEKSCGGIIYRTVGGTREYFVLINQKNDAQGLWGFPKGHTESTENEYETASREILEETGLYVVFRGGLRLVSCYSPKPGVDKEVVYFVAAVRDNQTVKLQKEEVADYRWCNYSEAKALLTFDKDILQKVENSFLK